MTDASEAIKQYSQAVKELNDIKTRGYKQLVLLAKKMEGGEGKHMAAMFSKLQKSGNNEADLKDIIEQISKFNTDNAS